tara:strand:+ start:747 stop:1253 length:507 start_codon:yes stop_codon:yes gene_type:complete
MNSNNSNNGRINLDNYQAGTPYVLHQQDSNESKTPYHSEALRNIQTKSPLSLGYFSEKNIQIIQNAIRYQVWIQSNKQHTISNQSENELQIIMRSIYLQYSRNLPTQISQQIESLNKLVVNYCVPIIMSNIQQYRQYRQDVSKLPVPQEHPQMVSSAGSKTLQPNFGF